MKSLRALRMHSNAERNAMTLQTCRRFVNSAFNGTGDDCARAQLDHWPVLFRTQNHVRRIRRSTVYHFGLGRTDGRLVGPLFGSSCN
jgi:hypothetical protein